MSDDNNYRSPKQALLGELESIKSILDKSSSDEFDESLSDELLDIPILDDVVPELSNNSQASGLLDLDNIFDDLDDGDIENPLIDSNDLQNQTAAQAITPSTPSALEQLNEQQAEQEQEQEQEASLQLDHLDANISFPAFTLDADHQDSNTGLTEQNQAEQIPTLEDQPVDSILLPSNDSSTAINTILQQDLAACLADNATSQAAAPLLTDLHSADDTSDDDDRQNSLPTGHDQPKPHWDNDTANSNPPENLASQSPSSSLEMDLDLMIQELVDEFIPPIEAELRKRLSKCSPAVIVELAKKHLDN